MGSEEAASNTPSTGADSPKPETTSGTSLLSLPLEIRSQIYRRVLALPERVLLFQNGARVHCAFMPAKSRHWLALLYTSQQLYIEARATVYASNSFALLYASQNGAELLEIFLDHIGSVNAGSLSRLYMDFPLVWDMDGQSGEARIGEGNLKSLRLLDERCTNLKTLEMNIHGLDSKGLIIPNPDDSPFMRGALSKIDARLRGIGSLRKVIVHMYDGSVTPSTMEFMRRFDWEVFGRR